MRWILILRDSQGLPLINVAMGDPRVIGAVSRVAGCICDHRHSLDTDDPFEGQVCLIPSAKYEISGRWGRTGMSTHDKDPAKSSVEI